MRKQIVIIGAGEIGRAIDTILRKKEIRAALWDKEASKMREQKPLAEIIPACDFVFLCVPSWAMREAIASIVLRLKRKAIVISLAKGIEEKTRKTTDELLEELLPPHQAFGILGGAMLAEELAKEMIGVGVIAAKETKVHSELKELFKNTNLQIEALDDVRGVALAGVLKNIYAIALGIADGLGWSGNQKGWLVSKAINEMTEIIQILGGKAEMVRGTAGLGDLVATGYSPYSRNRQVGDDLVRTGRCRLKSEGLIALPSIVALLQNKRRNFPLLSALVDIFINNQNVQTIFTQFIFREEK